MIGLSPVNSHAMCGLASWYGAELHGNKTASGERFNKNALTAAHRSIRLGTKVKVTANGKSVVVRINDRGPHKKTGKIIDLSERVAIVLGIKSKGVGRVCLRPFTS